MTRNTRTSDPLDDGPPAEHVPNAMVEALRNHADARWVEVSDRVIGRALTTTRRTLTISAQAPSGPIRVSEQVLLTYLRDAIDGTLPASALAHVTLQVRGLDELQGVLVELVAQYGTPLLDLADQTRALAVERLHEVLGPVPTPITVTALHVHFVDVVTGNPRDAGPQR